MKDAFGIIANIAAALTAIFAAWAAWEARKSAKASRDALDAQAVYAAMSEYFQPRMSVALRTLCSWSDRYGDHFATEWLQEFKKQTPEALAVDEAKRHIKGYFVKAARLYSASLIGKEGLIAVAYVHGLNIFYDVVMPLDEAQNPDVERETEQVLLVTIGRYKSRRPRF